MLKGKDSVQDGVKVLKLQVEILNYTRGERTERANSATSPWVQRLFWRVSAANSDARNVYVNGKVNKIACGVVSSHKRGKDLGRGGEVCEVCEVGFQENVLGLLE